MVAANPVHRLSYRNSSPSGLSARVTPPIDYRPPFTSEDLRIHAWLCDRVAVVHHERYGFWPRMRRATFSNRLVRWLSSATSS